MSYRCCYIQPYDHILIDYRSNVEHKTSQMWETDMVTNNHCQRTPMDRLEIKDMGLSTIESLKQEIKFQYFLKKNLTFADSINFVIICTTFVTET